MLTFEDCLRVCHLTEAEIDAIAEHEHLPAMVALELGSSLLKSPDGCQRITWMILDDMAAAQSHGDTRRALVLKETLKHFIDTHAKTSRLR